MKYWRFSNTRQEFKVKLIILFLDSNSLLIPSKQIFIFEKGFLPFAFLWSKVLVAILVALISAILWRRAFFTVFANFLQNVNRFEQKNSPRLVTDHNVSMGKIWGLSFFPSCATSHSVMEKKSLLSCLSCLSQLFNAVIAATLVLLKKKLNVPL